MESDDWDDPVAQNQSTYTYANGSPNQFAGTGPSCSLWTFPSLSPARGRGGQEGVLWNRWHKEGIRRKTNKLWDYASGTTACEFMVDTRLPGTLVGHAVEKWGPSTGEWECTVKSDTSWFCHSCPLGMIETRVVSKRLWPSQAISTGEEATAARGAFAMGDRAGFVVFRRRGLDFPTAAFFIDEHPIRPDVPYRVQR
jgi:hypothetical protein